MRSMITAAELRNDLEREQAKADRFEEALRREEDIFDSEQIRQALNEWLKKRGHSR